MPSKVAKYISEEIVLFSNALKGLYVCLSVRVFVCPLYLFICYLSVCHPVCLIFFAECPYLCCCNLYLKPYPTSLRNVDGSTQVSALADIMH